jgi:hypothetical protein
MPSLIFNRSLWGISACTHLDDPLLKLKSYKSEMICGPFVHVSLRRTALICRDVGYNWHGVDLAATVCMYFVNT